MKKNDIKKKLLNHIEVYNKYRIKKLGLFGSYLTGNIRKTSDIDLLVEFKETIDLFDFVSLSKELQKILGAKVDLVTSNALKPYIKNRVLREVEWF